MHGQQNIKIIIIIIIIIIINFVSRSEVLSTILMKSQALWDMKGCLSVITDRSRRRRIAEDFNLQVVSQL